MTRLVDIELIILRFTDAAVLVTDEEDGDEVWLPLSQIEIQSKTDHEGLFEVTMPEWLAQEKELV